MEYDALWYFCNISFGQKSLYYASFTTDIQQIKTAFNSLLKKVKIS